MCIVSFECDLVHIPKIANRLHFCRKLPASPFFRFQRAILGSCVRILAMLWWKYDLKHLICIANRSKQLYVNYHGTQSYAQRRYDEVKEGGVPQHVEDWRDMHFKGSSRWYNQLAEQHWENITDELNKAKSTSGGDDIPVDEVEVLQRSLGQWCGHVRGVGRKVKSITPDLPPHMYAPAANELQQQLAEANARWAEQQRINEMMQQQINKLMSMQGGQGSSSFYYPGFETNQEKKSKSRGR
ncbi:hypothetical protein R6Q57_023016 [Mikania cordata]